MANRKNRIEDCAFSTMIMLKGEDKLRLMKRQSEHSRTNTGLQGSDAPTVGSGTVQAWVFCAISFDTQRLTAPVSVETTD